MITKEEAFTLWRDKIETYEQGQHALSCGGRFCCLGVLCDLLKDEMSLDITTDGDSTLYDGRTGFLPSRVADFMGMTQEGHLKSGSSLTVLNDNGMSFREIREELYPENFKDQNDVEKYYVD